jgi:molecular chaperone DnaK
MIARRMRVRAFRAGATLKRLRVRLKALDREGLLIKFGTHVARDRVFLRTALALPPGAPVIVALSYQNGDLALFGEGKVIEQRAGNLSEGPGLSIAISWSPDCRELVEWLVTRSETHVDPEPTPPHVDLAADLTITPRPMPPPSISESGRTEYARIKTPIRSESAIDGILPPVPDQLSWSEEEKLEWDRQSGEVTPLARIDLVSHDQPEKKEDAIRSKSERVSLPPRTDRIVGIDLGTTYTCAAIVEDGKPRVIPSRRGTNTIPSVVLIHPEGKTIVGEPALRKQAMFPNHTLVGVKRLLGRPFHSPQVQRVRERYAYAIIEGDDGGAAVGVADYRISLEEISALILKEIRESVSLSLGEKVNRAVITCPAYYNERQRAAVRVAGELAGFHVERILSEPTAAALAYGRREGAGRRRVLVYDLGGGTFDASLMELDGNVFSVLAAGGDAFLGGADFDAAIVELILQDLRERFKLEASSDLMARARLFTARALRTPHDQAPHPAPLRARLAAVQL